MTDIIHISQTQNNQWIDTSIARTDGKIELRERPAFGKRHAVFDKNSEWGTVHFDEFNALDFPNGTIDHISKYTEEKTTIPHNIAKLGIVIGSIIVGVKLLKMLGDE